MVGSSTLDIYAGHTTLSISADSWDLTARAIAELRLLDGRVGPRGKLPPPVAAALAGRLRCRRPTRTELSTSS